MRKQLVLGSSRWEVQQRDNESRDTSSGDGSPTVLSRDYRLLAAARGNVEGSAEQFEGIDVPTEAVDVDVTLLLDELDVGHGFLDYLQLCSTS